MLTRILFEDLGVLAVLLALLDFVLLVLWARRRNRYSSRMLATGTLACGAMIGLSLVVQTPRERVVRVCRELARAIDEGDVPAIVGHLHTDFVLDTLDRETVGAALERALTRLRIDRPRLRRFDVQFVDSRTAVAIFSASAKVRSVDAVFERLPTRWRLTMAKEAEWHVLRVESLPVPPLNLQRLADSLR